MRKDCVCLFGCVAIKHQKHQFVTCPNCWATPFNQHIVSMNRAYVPNTYLINGCGSM